MITSLQALAEASRIRARVRPTGIPLFRPACDEVMASFSLSDA